MKFMAVFQGKAVPVEVIRKSGTYSLTINGKTFTVNAICPGPYSLSMIVDGRSHEVGLEKRDARYSVCFYNGTVELELIEARKYQASELTKKSGPVGALKLMAPMPGKIVKVIARKDCEVGEGEALLIIEAMKMQNELKAPRAGRIKQILVEAGQTVSPQQALLILE